MIASPLSLRDMADAYEQVQRTRIAAENRVRACLQGTDESLLPKLIASDPVCERLRQTEELICENMEVIVAQSPVYEWIMGVPGINRTIAAKILGIIDDPSKFARFSNLRTFCGLTPGKNKLVKGEKAIFSRRLKTTLFIAFASMLKAKGMKLKHPPQQMYANIYYQWRGIYAARFGAGSCKKKVGGLDKDGNGYTADDETAQQWPDLRQHFAAKNKLLDVFVYHIYEEWLAPAGLSPTLYVHEVLGHHAKYERAQFSSPQMSSAKRGKHATELAAV